MSGDSWEVVLDPFWIAVFQSVVIIAEHLVVLEITSERMEIKGSSFDHLSHNYDLPWDQFSRQA